MGGFPQPTTPQLLACKTGAKCGCDGTNCGASIRAVGTLLGRPAYLGMPIFGLW